MTQNYVISNLIPDIEDKRDFVFSSSIIELPKKFNYLDFVGEIENQLNTGSCVANATSSSLELLSLRNGIISDYSRLFLYYNLRESYDNLKGKDNGSYLRDGFKVINKLGIPDEKYWEFNVSNLNTEPSKEAYSKALQNKVTSYERILNDKNCLHNLKTAIFNGFPTIIALTIDKSFYNMKKTLETQDYIGTNEQQNIVGSHAMSIVGYDDELKCFFVENSWGISWGYKGIFKLSYDVLLKDCHDIWCCTGFKDFKMDAKIEIKKPTVFDKVKNYFKNIKQNKSEILFYLGVSIVAITVILTTIFLFIA